MSPLGETIGFTPLPAAFFALLVVMTATYLGIVEGTKRWFFAASNWQEA
jgi:Mg2+-importing ATPase